MTPQEIAENWIAENGEIRPVNPYCNCATKQNCENIKCEEFEVDVVIKHTYPCPTLADGEYTGEDLEFYGMKVSDCLMTGNPIYNTAIRLKQPPAIDAGETVEDVMNDWFSKQDAVVDPEAAFIAGHTHATNDANLVPLDKVEAIVTDKIIEVIKLQLEPEAKTTDMIKYSYCKDILEDLITQIKNFTK